MTGDLLTDLAPSAPRGMLRVLMAGFLLILLAPALALAGLWALVTGTPTAVEGALTSRRAELVAAAAVMASGTYGTVGRPPAAAVLAGALDGLEATHVLGAFTPDPSSVVVEVSVWAHRPDNADREPKGIPEAKACLRIRVTAGEVTVQSFGCPAGVPLDPGKHGERAPAGMDEVRLAPARSALDASRASDPSS